MVKKTTSLNELYNLNSTNKQAIIDDVTKKKNSSCDVLKTFLTSNNPKPVKMGRTQGTGLTQTSGTYALVCETQNKVLVGSSTNLGQRKGEYKYSMVKNQSISASVTALIQTHQLTFKDFGFLPLCILSPEDKAQIEVWLGSTYGKDSLSVYLDWLEEMLLNEFLSNASFSNVLLNQKSTNQFQTGNPGGSHGRGGFPKQAITNGEIAFESLSKAEQLGWGSRKTLSTKAKSKLDNWRFIQVDDYNKWDPAKKNIAKTS